MIECGVGGGGGGGGACSVLKKVALPSHSIHVMSKSLLVCHWLWV
jgi:hypothetical protein